MIDYKKTILIFGKSNIAIRHYKIIKKIFDKDIYFVSKNKYLTLRKNNKFIKTKIKYSDQIIPFMAIISSTSDTHLYYLKKLINKSKYILVEKPFSNNYQKSVNFFKSVKNKKIKSKILIGYNLKFMNILVEFKKLITKKVLGKIYFVEAKVGKSLYLWRNGNLNFACTNPKRGGGVLLELSHELDYLNWIFGNLKVLNKYINPRKFFKYDIEQHVFVTLTSRNFPISLSMDLLRKQPERSCSVICEKGFIKMDLIRNNIIVKNNKNSKLIKFPKNDLNRSYERQLDSLLTGKNRSFKSIKDSIETLSLISKIKNKN